MRIFLGVLIFSTCLSLGAQDLRPESPNLRADPLWYQYYSSERFLSNALTLGPDSEIYTAGSFQSYLQTEDTTYYIPPQGAFRQSFANYPFLQKHSLGGQLAWTAYAIGEARVADLATDQKGNVYLCGEVWSEGLTFVSANGRKDSLAKPKDYTSRGIYLAKFSPQGQILHSTFISSDRYDAPHTMAIDSEGNIILGGVFMYSKENTLTRNYLLHKISPDFELIWSKLGNSKGRSQILDIAIDRHDNIYLSGSYAQYVKLGEDSLHTAHDTYKGLFAKLDPNGRWLSLQGAITDPSDQHIQVVGNGLTPGPWGKSIMVGSSFGRFFHAQLNRKGEVKWIQRSIGRSTYPFGLHPISKRRYLSFGHGYGASLISHPPKDSLHYQSKGSTDFFVAEFKSSGRLVKMLVGGGEATDYVTDLAYRDGKIYVLGHDLGGPAIEFGTVSFPDLDNPRRLNRYPRMWLACFEWGD